VLSTFNRCGIRPYIQQDPPNFHESPALLCSYFLPKVINFDAHHSFNLVIICWVLSGRTCVASIYLRLIQLRFSEGCALHISTMRYCALLVLIRNSLIYLLILMGIMVDVSIYLALCRSGRLISQLKMGEIVSSAVVHETVNKIISGLVDKYERKSSAEEQMERLEMAQIKLEIALETSNKWQITSGPLLRWQKKLKRAAEECDDTLRKCRQRVEEEEEVEQQVRNSSFPKRIAHATKSMISSIFHGNIDEPTVSSVRRFEWFAEGANDFLRSVEFGGTPHRYSFFDPLIGHLLAGETLEYKSVQGNKQHLFWIRPNNISERRVEAKLIFIYNDCSAPEDNFFLGMMLQLSESTNIVGTTIRCLQLFSPYFSSSTTEAVRKELTQLPTQDFSWVPRSRSVHWDSIHRVATEWFRPNPLCCKHGHKVCSSGYMDKIEFCDVSLEPVIEVYLESQIFQYSCNKQRADVQGKICSPRRPSYLKLGVFLLPHVSSTDLLPATESFAVEVINGEEQLYCHKNVTLEKLNRIMLPKAIDSFNQNAEVTAHQLLWKSKHEAAFFHVWNTRMNMSSILSTARKSTLLQQHDHLELESRADVISEFLKLWVDRAPVMMQFAAVDWIQALLGEAGDSKKLLMSM
jgi:hypothetical protein